MAKKSRLENESTTIRTKLKTQFVYNSGYTDYLEYISDVYGTESFSYRFLEGLISNEDVAFAMKLSEVGTIKDINVSEAMAGIITTNPNHNLTASNKFNDTRLGKLNNTMYSNTLYQGANFNSARNRDEYGSFKSYITPSLYRQYGNNDNNINHLSDILRVSSTSSGRTSDDLDSTIKIIDDYATYSAETDYGGKLYLDELLKYNQNIETTIDNSGTKWIRYAYSNASANTQYVSTSINKDSSTNTSTSLLGQVLSDGGVFDGFGSGKTREVGYTTTRVGATKGSTYKHPKASDPKYHFVYTDTDSIQSSALKEGSEIANNEWDQYTNEVKGQNNLLAKTQQLVKARKIQTMFGRFYNNDDGDSNYVIDTAINDKYGTSHGRALLKKNPDQNTGTNGYDNPYCRVWTYHHQYNSADKLIRGGNSSFIDDVEKVLDSYSPTYIDYDNNNKTTSARHLLRTNSVLSDVYNHKSSRVKIAPHSEDGGDSIKNCMLSIENLAWKDVNMGDKVNVHKNNVGPNGGRIMWFPPYDIDFNENVSVNWNPNAFIGRGEKVYTYGDTDRTGQLSFTMIIDHPSIINYIATDTNKDIDDEDVLRFFAGCSLPELKGKPDDDDEVVVPPTDPTPENDDNKKIVLPVFFPNDYSGYMNFTGDTNTLLNNVNKIKSIDTLKDFVENNYNKCDSDTWLYLMYGKILNAYGGDGYEIAVSASTSGVSYSDGVLKKSLNNTGYSAFTENNKTHYWQYRVDKSLRGEKLVEVSKDSKGNYPNYSDSCSVGLNKKASLANEQWKKDFNYSFYDFMTKNETLFSILKDENIKFTSIKFCGGADKHNQKTRNVLAHRRIGAIIQLLWNSISARTTNDTDISIEVVEGVSQLGKSVSETKAKAQRVAWVEITYNNSESNAVNGNNVEEGVSTDTDAGTNGDISNKKNDDDTQDTNSVGAVSSTIVGNNVRYENEDEYFHRIKTEDPDIYKKITDKIKHFDPAYHSMTPEGFNARLTFLQQCTRQGHTISTSDGSFAETAGNLSFGRMPVCVLRIGDFINSRVIVQSLGINYSADGMQWDLNPEGAGVQPMFAKITLGIVLLGGQSMQGPINRLQNASTFNYYANTQVYDDRSDIAKYNKSTQKTEYTRIWTPTKTDK